METIFNNNTVFMILLVTFTAMVCAATMWLIPRMAKQGTDVAGMIEKSSMAISALDTVTDALRALLPNTPGLQLVDKILEYAGNAVAGAEQMYKASQIPKEKRKEEAMLLVRQYLKAAGIEVTEEMEKIIEGSVEASVFALPKTNEQS